MKDDCERCGKPHLRCNGHNSEGNACGNRALADAQVCRFHGGRTPSVQGGIEKRRQDRRARLAVETFGLPVEVGPHEALMQELHRCAGAVEWLSLIVADLEREDVVWGQTEERIVGAGQWPGTDTFYGADINTWVKLWQAERAQLVKVSKVCIEAGIEERKVRVAEAAGEQLAMVIRAVLDELDLTADQRAIASVAVPRQFRRLATAA